jgi:anti-sigma factor RsiW
MSGSRGNASEVPSEQCRALAPSLAAFVEGALPEDEARIVATHVAGCGWCAEQVAAYVKVDALVREESTPTPPASLRAGLYARIAAETERASHGHRMYELETIVRETDTHTHDIPVVSAPVSSPLKRSPRLAALTRLLAFVATVLIVALLASVLTRLGQSSGRTTPVAMPTSTATSSPACSPGAVQASLPARAMLGDLAMTSPGTGWAVGSVSDGNFSINDPQGSFHTLIMRLADCHWAPFGPSFPNAGLGSIAMVLSNEGWVVGNTQANTPLLLHYHDDAWRQVTVPAMGNIDSLLVVRVLPSGEVWIAGRTPAGTRASSGIALLHLADGKWTRIETPLSNVTDIGPVGPGDAWILGYGMPVNNVYTPELARILGGAVTQVVPLDPRDVFNNLRMLAPNDGWALGIATVVSGNETSADPTVTRPLALRYDGSSWTEVNTGVSSNARAIDVLGPGMAWSYTTAVPDPNRGEFIASTLRENAGKWTNVSWPYKDIRSMSRITCVTPDDCWAIGMYALPDTPQTINGSTVIVVSEGWLLLRYANGAWYQYGHA